MSQPQLCRGAIVRGEGLVGILWQTLDDVPIVAPIVVKDAGRHRSDVNYDEALLPRKGAIRVGAIRSVRSKLTVTGHVSDATIAAVAQALDREVRAVQFESRFPVETRSRHETAVRF